MNRKIERVQYKPGCDKVTLQWRDNYTDTVFQNSSYDYAVIAVPFSIVKKWRFSSRLPRITRSIAASGRLTCMHRSSDYHQQCHQQCAIHRSLQGSIGVQDALLGAL